MRQQWLNRALVPAVLLLAAFGKPPQPLINEPANMTLTSSSPELQLPGSLTLTATVTPETGSEGAPTGNVQFNYDGTNSLGTAPLTVVPGSARFSAGADQTTIGNTSFGLVALNYAGSPKLPKYSILAALGYWFASDTAYPQITVYQGGPFTNAVTYQLPAGNSTPYSFNGGVDAFAVADFNHDGIPDVLLHGPSATGSVYYVVPGTGAGAFATTGIPTQDPATCLRCASPRINDRIAVDDFNEDGYPDVAYINQQTGTMEIGLNGAGADGNPAGTFAKFISLPSLPAGDSFSPTAIATGHLTASGHADIIVAGNLNAGNGVLTGELLVYLGNGDGSFANPVLVSAPPDATQVATADFRNSGTTDVAVSNAEGVLVYFNDGKGALTASSQLSLGSLGPVAVADFNADGFPDFLTIVGGTPFVFLNNGKGLFFKPTTFTTTSGLTSAVTGDFNGDGLTDIAAFAAADSDTDPAYAFINSASAQAQLVTAPQTLPRGNHILNAAFPGDSDYGSEVSNRVQVTVTQTIPSLTWPLPASIEYGIPLGAAQLDATSNVAGVLTYSSLAGTVLPPGPDKVTAMFVPTDTFDYAGATAVQTITVAAPTLTAVSPTATCPGEATNLTVQGQGLLNGAVVKWNGTALATTWVSLNQLTAAVPAALVSMPGPATITAVDPNNVAIAGSASIAVCSPTLTGISPISANLGAAFTLTVIGQDLLNGAVVNWNGAPLATTWVSLTQLTAAVPASLLTTPGTAKVTVVDPNNVSVTGTQAFTISAPTLTGVSPNAASLGVAANLTVQGQGLLNGAVVKWNGTALATTWVSFAQLTAAVPAALVNTPGTATITVVDPNNVPVSGSASVTVSSATLTGISPALANLGAAFTLTVNGQGLLNGAVVKWNGSALTTTWVNLAQLTAAVPASLLTTPGTATVTVVDPNNVSVAGTQTFTISPPTLAGISPTSANLGASDTTLTITGQGFLNGAVVNWNNTPLATAWVSLTQLTAVIPASLLAIPGPATITVLDPNKVAVNGTQKFLVSGTPTLAGISPVGAGLGAPITLTVTGQGFVNGAVVQWNASPLATTWVSLTQLTAVVPASLLSTPGTATVTVIDPNNVSVSGKQTFTIAPPTLAGISPTSVNLGASDTTLTVTGQGFLSGAIVKWNGSPLATTWASLTRLTAVIPASLLANAGTATVSVVDPQSVSVSGTETFAILAGPATVQAKVPTTIDAGQASPPTIQLTVNPYPVAITATLTLVLTPASSSDPPDPGMRFPNNSQQDTIEIQPDGSPQTEMISFYPGSTPGTITLTIRLSANGTDVTPTSLVPIPITVPVGPPVILTATLSRDGDAMTVTLTGLSTTRDMNQAEFHFTPAAGETLGTTDLKEQLDSPFNTYYQSSSSDGSGTTFQYQQPFTLTSDSSKVGSITVTLTNSQGTSQPATVQ